MQQATAEKGNQQGVVQNTDAENIVAVVIKTERRQAKQDTEQAHSTESGFD